MKKIYFASAPWAGPSQLIENVISQTPNKSGVWGTTTYTLNKNEADFILVQDATYEDVDETKVIFTGREPKHVVGAYREWTKKSFGNFHHEKGNSWLPQNWWIKKSFEELQSINPIKEKNLSIIDTGKRLTNYHNFRVELINKLSEKFGNKLDLYGNISGRVLTHRDKTIGLEKYRYNLAIENGRTDFYFSEKFCDPILLLTCPIYSGCKKIDKFFPKGSYIEIDDTKSLDYNSDRIIEISESNYREENIENIKEARHLILNKYNIWNTLDLIVNTGKVI